MKWFALILVAVLVALAVTNPDEADFREHIREHEGIVGTLGIAVADLFSGDKKGGIGRDNYVIASRFYIGGDGIIPRQDVAWGVAGRFFETERTESRGSLLDER